MSSKQADEMGLKRKGDTYEEDPKHFTILDVDIKREKLLKLYEGKPTEIAIINAIKQKRRQKALGDPDFVESCESGLVEPGHFIRLKPDNNGKVWLLIDKGNNRNFALRIVNERRARDGHPPLMFKAIQAPRPGSGDATGAYVKEKHALSNVRAKTLPSQKAEMAASFAADGLPAHSIIRYLDQVDTEAEVLDLIELDACVESIKDAIDAGLVKVSAAAKVARWTEDKQEEWLKAKLAPKPAKVKPTVRPLAPKKVTKLAEALAKHYANDKRMSELYLIFAGKVRPEDAKDFANRKFLAEAIGVTFEEA
jgi:hypothetical protein